MADFRDRARGVIGAARWESPERRGEAFEHVNVSAPATDAPRLFPGTPARRGDLRHRPRAAAPPRRYRTSGLVRPWSLAMQRRSAPLGRLQPGIVTLALAGTMRCPVMPP